MRLALLIVLAFSLPRLVQGVVVPLMDDEAYYWLWATQPALSYYDHPPMVAWSIAAGRALLGDTLLAVRLPFVLALAGAALLAAAMAGDLARARGPQAVAGAQWRAALLASAGWLVLPVFATPDAVALLFWGLTLWAVLRVAQGGGAAFAAVAGVAMGLGILSKFTDLFLGVGVVVWLALSVEGRRIARGASVWVALLFVAATLAPFLAWNAVNDWVGFEKQFGRIVPGQFDWQNPLIYLASAALALGPFALIWAARGQRLAGPGRALLLITLVPLPLYLFAHSFQHDAPASWLGPLVFPLAVLGALAPVAARGFVAASLGWAALGWAALGIVLMPGTPLIRADNQPNTARGWAAVVAEVRLRSDGVAWIATTDYALVGRLAWEMPDLPVWGINEPVRYLFRGDLPADLCDAPALLVEYAALPTLAPRFAEAGAPALIERRSGDAVLSSLRATPVRGLTGAPCPAD